MELAWSPYRYRVASIDRAGNMSPPSAGLYFPPPLSEAEYEDFFGTFALLSPCN